ncbi:MAG TPA: TM2 domain-containing protein [Gemmatimonadaceae bacterium]|nr:TM2 domain-containing protein [Gemmatimonadaceae bacterium]
MTHAGSALLPTKFCPSCGAIIDGKAQVCPTCKTMQPVVAQSGQLTYSASDKRILPAVVLMAVLLPFSPHRFYVGKVGTAVLQIVTLGGLGFWWLYDFIKLVTGTFEDAEGNKINLWT